MAEVKLDGISRAFRSGGESVQVLSCISFFLKDGGTLAVTGPSGSGKTTLLNIIGGLDRPDSGTVLVNGRDIASLSEKDAAAYRNSEVGFLFQESLLLPQLTVLENILLPCLPSGTAGDEVKTRAEKLLERVNLAHRRNAFPATLSGGEKQRAALVRALIRRPALLLADEPTGALDRANAENLIELLLELNGEMSLTLIIATHSEFIAGRMKEHFRL